MPELRNGRRYTNGCLMQSGSGFRARTENADCVPQIAIIRTAMTELI